MDVKISSGYKNIDIMFMDICKKMCELCKINSSHNLEKDNVIEVMMLINIGC